MKQSKPANRKRSVTRAPEPSTKKPDLTLTEARTMLRLVARQLAVGELTETQAYNHVADIGVMAGVPSTGPDSADYFEDYLKYLGGPKRPKPVPMRLTCPECGTLHIDVGEFATKLHHTHSCQECGLTWRPAVVHTVGVRFLPGFRNAEPETSERAT